MTGVAVPQSETLFDQLSRMDRGRVDRECTAATRELVKEMTWAADHGVSKPKGRVTITVDFTLDRGMMDVVADFTVKQPKKARGRTVLFPGPSGELLAEDPKQLSLDIGRGPVVDTPEPTRNIRAL